MDFLTAKNHCEVRNWNELLLFLKHWKPSGSLLCNL